MSDTDDALFLLDGVLAPDRGGLIVKTVFPSAATKPTKKECYAALARVLREAASEMIPDDPDPADSAAAARSTRGFVLLGLAECFDSTCSDPHRIAEIKNRGKGYETNWGRDGSMADLVQKLRKTHGPKRAISEAAALIGCHPKSVREARKRLAKRLREARKEPAED